MKNIMKNTMFFLILMGSVVGGFCFFCSVDKSYASVSVISEVQEKQLNSGIAKLCKEPSFSVDKKYIIICAVATLMTLIAVIATMYLIVFFGKFSIFLKIGAIISLLLLCIWNVSNIRTIPKRF